MSSTTVDTHYTESLFFGGLDYISDNQDRWNTFNLTVIDYTDDKPAILISDDMSSSR
jgi:hypothetical protein